VRCTRETSHHRRFFNDGRESSHGAQIMASKTRVLQALRDRAGVWPMLSNAIEESAVEFEPVFTWAPNTPQETRPDWRTVDRALRAIRRSVTITGTAEQLEIHRSGPVIRSAHAKERAVRATTSATGAGAHVGATEAATAPVADANAQTWATIEPASRMEARAHVGVADAVAVLADLDAPAEEATPPALRTDVGAHMGAVRGATISATETGARMGAGGTASKVDIGAPVSRTNVTTSTKAGGDPVGSGSASRLDVAILCAQAKAALTGLGWKPAIAHAAVAAAAASQGVDMTLERLVFESLRRCPAPRA
jgi:hypothetical protein